MASSGKVPEEKWLLWDTMGWHGGWGTTYAFNLCLYVKDMSEEQWVAMALTKQSRPPMPWFTLREMKDADLRAIYRFLRVLGPAGEPAPAYLPPGGSIWTGGQLPASAAAEVRRPVAVRD